jgi:N-alpha-acetyltransferase 35, NatC auxiliary subunit
MDPKMDSGFLAQGEAIEDDYNVSQSLLPEQVLGVMDALLSVEVAWHMGHPLSQTLFTSIYVDYLLWPEPLTLEDASFDRRAVSARGNALIHVVLRSYCLALIKACEYVHQSICAETFFEVSCGTGPLLKILN